MTGSSFTPMPPYKACQALPVFSKLYWAMKKLSGKAGLAVYSHYVVVSG